MSMIRKIAEPQFLRQIWGRIFASDDPFGCPFTQRITARIIFYPTKGYHLSEKQYKAMIVAARASGDEGFIVSIIEGEGDIVDRGEHWWCEYPTYAAYLSLPLVLENAIYSKHADWGLMISHEDHAVIGGDEKFVDTLRAAYPEWRIDIQELTQFWKENPNGSWVATLNTIIKT